jgi:hypothetical protein
MCNSCWNVKTFEAKKRNNENCDGVDMTVMSLNELKQNLTQEWMETKETHFDVFKKAISDAQEDEFTFTISDSFNTADIHVHLV